MPTLKVGLIGCGRIAQLIHINILTSLPEVKLVALAEPDPQRREEAQQLEPRALAFTDYRELLTTPEVEAVVICLPNALHREATVAALEAHKHVYLEKPLAASLKEGQEVLAAWQRADVAGMIGFNYRFNALYQTIKRHIESGRLGELVSVRSVFSTPVRTLPTWKQARQSGGGVLLDLASHHIDLVHFLFEEKVCEVFAGLRSQRSEDDSATLHLRLSSGLLIQSFFSMSAVDEDRLEIYGQAGKLAVDRYLSLNVETTDPMLDFSRLKWLRRGLRSLIRSPYLLEKICAPSSEPSYRAALAHFAAAVRTGRPASPDFWDGYRSLAVIEAAEESARTGRMVSLSDLTYEDSTC
jgi:myo-inositol 2-dehydrogenase/D-chiro-inositol 1-dehydrogenase